jgi:N6-L-threonylcarbamoyladenine synthase
VAQPDRPARPLRRGRARDRQPGHVELLTPVVAQALVEAGFADDDDRRRGRHERARAGRALLVGVSAAKALALVWDVPFVA